MRGQGRISVCVRFAVVDMDVTRLKVDDSIFTLPAPPTARVTRNATLLKPLRMPRWQPTRCVYRPLVSWSLSRPHAQVETENLKSEK